MNSTTKRRPSRIQWVSFMYRQRESAKKEGNRSMAGDAKLCELISQHSKEGISKRLECSLQEAEAFN